MAYNWIMFDGAIMVGGVIVCIVLGAVAAVLLIYLGYALRSPVPFVPTPRPAMEAVIAALDLPRSGIFYDLGCGDGRVLAAAREQSPELRLAGVDTNPVPLKFARWRLGRRVLLLQAGAKDVKLGGVVRVFTFLGPTVMAELEGKFERELPRGARLVSMQFPLPNRRPVQEIELAAGRDFANKLYVYEY